MKEIAVLMTVFNRKDKTLNCLKDLSRMSIPEGYSYEVWLTNDGCTDGTSESVKREYPYTHIIDGDGNLYWNRGMWKAWDAASRHKEYDYYLWLNDDIVLYENSLEKLIEESICHKDKCIIVGPMQFVDHHGVSYGGVVNHKRITPKGQAERVDYFNGNLVLVPKYVYEQIGNLDYHYSHGHGDTDYGLRAKEVGIESYLVGDYLGECDRHEHVKKCWDSNCSIKQRFNNLYHPTGYPPKEAFYFEKKHYGLMTATFHQITLYLRVLFPKIWKNMGKLIP